MEIIAGRWTPRYAQQDQAPALSVRGGVSPYSQITTPPLKDRNVFIFLAVTTSIAIARTVAARFM